MSIARALSHATSGLSAAALRASIASNNVANANSPGYIRRDLSLGERAYGGVQVNGITRSQDFMLSADRRIAEASVNRADVIANTRIQFSQALGDPEAGYGLFSVWQQFETTMNDLAVTPESPTHQSAVLLASQELVSEFNDLSAYATDQRVAADAAIGEAVTTINDALHQLDAINGDIVGVAEGSEQAANLEDRRQQLLDTIGRFMPIKTMDVGDGKINIMTREGVFLLGNSVKELSFSKSPTIVPGDSWPGGSLSGISVDGTDITPGSTGRYGVQSGALAGYFEVRDTTGPEFQAQLDALAADMVSRFQDSGADPTLLPGDAGLFTDNGGAFDPADTVGLAGRLALNAAIDPAQGGATWRLRDGLNATVEGPPGNSDILNSLVDAIGARRGSLAGVGMAGQFSMAEGISEVNSAAGAARTHAEATVASASARAEILASAEQNGTAVDTDKEMQALLMIEQAYAANARVIETVNTMMQRILEI